MRESDHTPIVEFSSAISLMATTCAACRILPVCTTGEYSEPQPELRCLQPSDFPVTPLLPPSGLSSGRKLLILQLLPLLPAQAETALFPVLSFPLAVSSHRGLSSSGGHRPMSHTVITAMYYCKDTATAKFGIRMQTAPS